MTAPAEERAVHSRLLKCTLEIEDARAYWQRAEPGHTPSADVAFETYWFGAKSLDRVKVLLLNFQARYDAFPQALKVLGAWREMEPVTRALVCHWHAQLADPMYRSFTGRFLVDRRDALRAEITRDLVVGWVEDQAPGRWTLPTRIQFASKLLSAASSAGLVVGTRDPRPLAYPSVADDALTYLMYLLRDVDFEGTLLDNPYLRSVGLAGRILEERLRGLSALRFGRQGDLVDFGWRYPSLEAWAGAEGLLPAAGGEA